MATLVISAASNFISPLNAVQLLWIKAIVELCGGVVLAHEVVCCRPPRSLEQLQAYKR
jgi:hypothetical protein